MSRRQDLLIQSDYTQQVKGGGVREKFNDFIEKAVRQKRFKFDKHLNPWKKAFGVSKIIVRPLEKNQLYGGDIFKDFLHFINFPESNIVELNITKSANESPGHKTIEVIRTISNILVDKVKTGQRKDINYRYLSPILKYSNKNSWNTDKFNQLTLEDSTRIIQKFEESNSRVAKEYLNREDKKLFYDEINLQNKTSFDINDMSNEDFLEIILILLEQLWNEIDNKQ